MAKTKNRAPGATGNPAEEETNCKNNSELRRESQDIKAAAIEYLQVGLSVIPVNPESKMTTLKTWKPYQKAPMSQEAAAGIQWPGLAIIGGKVSGHVEALDFDFKAAWFDQWAAIVEAEAPGLIARLTRQTTQSGGKHIIYRCPGFVIPGNTKLASDKIEVDGSGDYKFMDKIHRAHQESERFYIYPCYIETRGEGGYFLAALTDGYSLESGDLSRLPEITPGERELLIRAAKAQDKNVKPKYQKQPTIDGTRPGDHYNNKADPRPLLGRHGWKAAGSMGDFEHWTRPGKNRGISASLIGGKLFHVFTSNAPPLDQWQAYTPFALYATLEHNGDFEAAARALRRHGYGGETGTDGPPGQEPSHSRGNSIKPVSIDDFLALEFPPRNNILSPWLPTQGLVMVYAHRGIGKTFFALSVAYAVTSGGNFLAWTAIDPVGVLYIDGEMPAPVMQERLSQIVAGAEQEPKASFILLTPDLQPEGMPRIDDPQGQQAIEKILTPEIKLIVVDNISTLTAAKENEADGWTPVQAWALRQRQQGRTVMFVHHAGKGGAQRGTSRREDVLDTVLLLKRPVDYHADQGAVFEVHFEKARGLYGDDVAPVEARLSDITGVLAWNWKTVEATTFDRVVALLQDKLTQKEIADELSLNKSTVSRHTKRARAEGYL